MRNPILVSAVLLALSFGPAFASPIATGWEQRADLRKESFQPMASGDAKAVMQMLDTDFGRRLVELDPFWGEIKALGERGDAEQALGPIQEAWIEGSGGSRRIGMALAGIDDLPDDNRVRIAAQLEAARFKIEDRAEIVAGKALKGTNLSDFASLEKLKSRLEVLAPYSGSIGANLNKVEEAIRLHRQIQINDFTHITIRDAGLADPLSFNGATIGTLSMPSRRVEDIAGDLSARFALMGLIHQAAFEKSAPAYAKLGQFVYDQKKDTPVSAALLRSAVLASDGRHDVEIAPQIHLLGVMHRFGEGVALDLVSARALVLTAARLGYAKSILMRNAKSFVISVPNEVDSKQAEVYAAAPEGLKRLASERWGFDRPQLPAQSSKALRAVEEAQANASLTTSKVAWNALFPAVLFLSFLAFGFALLVAAAAIIGSWKALAKLSGRRDALDALEQHFLGKTSEPDADRPWYERSYWHSWEFKASAMIPAAAVFGLGLALEFGLKMTSTDWLIATEFGLIVGGFALAALLLPFQLTARTADFAGFARKWPLYTVSGFVAGFAGTVLLLLI